MIKSSSMCNDQQMSSNCNDVFELNAEESDFYRDMFSEPDEGAVAPASSPVSMHGEKHEQGVCGLKNLGNTCFMNAGLQCLISNAYLCQHFFHEKTLSKKLSISFTKLLCEMWSMKEVQLKPEHFKHSLSAKHSQFEGFRQHDCQEFLALLLNSLHEELNRPESESAKPGITAENFASQAVKAALTKESKTRNTNVEIGDTQQQVCVDSIKFCKSDVHPRKAIQLTTRNPINRGAVNKSNLKKSAVADSDEDDAYFKIDSPSGAMKKMRLDESAFAGDTKHGAYSACNFDNVDSDFEIPLNNRMTSPPDDELLNKIRIINPLDNHRHKVCNEVEHSLALRTSKLSNIEAETRFKNSAENAWNTHIKQNKSVIVDTFQGQFKSSVLCQECGFTSVTYEPFMYLTLPLPHAFERQIETVFVNWQGEAMSYLVTVSKFGTMACLKQELLNMIAPHSPDLAFAAVQGHCVERVLNESNNLAYISTNERETLYAFEMCSWHVDEDNDDVKNTDVPISTTALCSICLEDFLDIDLYVHSECKEGACCENCLDSGIQHTDPINKMIRCPTCMKISSASLFKLMREPSEQESVRILCTPVAYRRELVDSNDKRVSITTITNPRLVYLPERIEAKSLYAMIRRHMMAVDCEFSLYRTDYKGLRCSLCDSVDCQCSFIPETDGMTKILPGSCLTVHIKCLESTVAEVLSLFNHGIKSHDSMNHLRNTNELTLNECIEAFTQGETLDANNPWFCPSCKKNQLATKTISLWRLPQTLIIYLKRFYFINAFTSNKINSKVSFPTHNLNMAPFIINSDFQQSVDYTLQSCICHFGSVNFGHYTAYAKNPCTENWFYFNDDTVTVKQPSEEDSADIYILFYQRNDSSASLTPPHEDALNHALQFCDSASSPLLNNSRDVVYNVAVNNADSHGEQHSDEEH